MQSADADDDGMEADAMKNIHSEKRLVRRIRKGGPVIIYGAGMVGELACGRLLAHGLRKKIIGFAVTKKTDDGGSQDFFCGLPVCGIEELERYREDALVIVATLPGLHGEITKNLLRLRYANVMCVSPRLHQDFFRNYAADFKKSHPIRLAENPNLRILLMASDNSPASGAFLCMAELCSRLLESGAAVLAVLPKYGQGAALLERRGIPYTYVPARDWGYEMAKEHDLREKMKFLMGMMRNGRARRELASLMREHSIELAHCNTTYAHIAALAAKCIGIPFVWHIREWMENQGYRMFMPRRGWRLIGQAARVIAVSEYIRGLIPSEIGDSARVVYDAVEMRERDCAEREILRHDCVRMIMVGGIARHKRQMELIEACAILKGADTCAFHLDIVGVGDADYTEELRRAVSGYGMDGLITFRGLCSGVSTLYAESDIAFTCGVMEGYGRVTVEAQMAGCLAIGANAGGTPELIRDGETGFLYEPGSPESLAEKIAAAAGDPEEAGRIARAGQKYALGRYTAERSFREIMDAYEAALGRKIARKER